MAVVIAFIKLSRLHFLLGGFVMFGLGAGSAEGSLNWFHYLCAQAMVTLAQLTAHYVNEYADYDADLLVANRTQFSGGSGILTSGSLPRIVALRAGQATALLALLAALLVATFSIPAAALGLVALFVSWTYSMPPMRLLGTGWGELFTAVTVAGLVPLIGSFSQGSGPSAGLTWMIFVLVLLQLAMLLAFELPDATTDRIAGKHVLAARLGPPTTYRLIVFLYGAASMGVAAAFLTEGLSATQVIGTSTAVPIAFATVCAIRRQHHSLMTFCAVTTFFLVSCALVVTTV